MQPATSAAAGTAAGSFGVKVVDAAGSPVSGVSVVFTVTGPATVSPGSAVTDANGAATTQVTLGTIAGISTVRATATGVSTSASVQVTGVPGPLAKLVATPKTIRLTTVGDTARVVASAQDLYGNAAPPGTFTYAVVDPTLVSVDATGLVRALRANGTTLVITSSSGAADTTTVTVLPAASTACTGLAAAITMAVGEVRTFSGAQYGCLSGTPAGAEFEMTLFNSATDQLNTLNVSVTGNGLATAPSTLRAPTSGISLLRSSIGGPLSAAPRPDETFHLALLRRARALLRGRGAAARSIVAARLSIARLPGSALQPSARSVISASAKVGDLITANVSANDCLGAINHALRVTAIGTRSIILSDTLNPANGFSASDFQRFAARFDTLVYPLDVGAFGTPSDIDGNGRVAVIFTRAVNELTPANAGYYVGGFFNPRDLLPRTGATPALACPGSNEGEMFYMLAPDPTGVVNGNTHTTSFVDSVTTGTIAHEFQHLINASRRLYVNNAPVNAESEDTWLNEGLSHIAEELLYYRESGLTPRLDLNDSLIRIVNRPTYPFWRNDAFNNFERYEEYLASPWSNSPYADDDQLATRGATWSFLRYTADRLRSTDGDIWQRFDNSITTGLATLTNVIGSDPTPFFRDWTVSNYMDDDGVTADPNYQQPSWNFRDIFMNTFLGTPVYPLQLRGLVDNIRSDFTIRGGSAAYARFSVTAGGTALLTFTSGGGLPNAPLQFVVIRTK